MTESRFNEIAQLIRNKLQGGLSEEENIRWEQWLSESPDNLELAKQLEDPVRLREAMKSFHASREKILGRILEELPELNANHRVSFIVHRKSRRALIIRRSFRYAAVFILLMGLSGILWYTLKPGSEKTVEQPVHPLTSIQPGTNKAVLTLGNGSRIVLDSSNRGLIASEGGVAITVRDNRLSYAETSDTATVTWNTMTTPRGGQFRLTLPDGTAVWLNAQSSITYPVRFTGGERKVSVTGEAYFEVFKNPSQPFVADIRTKGEVRVFGTHFDINAYEDEHSINTTLLEGSVSVSAGKNRRTIEPGQQVRILSDGSLEQSSLTKSELSEVTAWKDGSFYFEEADIRTVMRQMQRWYDVDIEYQGEVREKFHLDIRRSTTLDNVFRILQETRGVHFKIEGRKIKVMP